MPRWLAAVVLGIEAFNRRIGRMTMYLLFGMMAILLWSSISKTFFLPALWTLETAQFALTAYVFLGGAYALQLGSNVRMDLFYSAASDLLRWFLIRSTPGTAGVNVGRVADFIPGTGNMGQVRTTWLGEHMLGYIREPDGHFIDFSALEQEIDESKSNDGAVGQ